MKIYRFPKNRPGLQEVSVGNEKYGANEMSNRKIGTRQEYLGGFHNLAGATLVPQGSTVLIAWNYLTSAFISTPDVKTTPFAPPMCGPQILSILSYRKTPSRDKK